MERSETAAESCDLLLALGTTLSVYPIAGVVPVAKRAGAQIILTYYALEAAARQMHDRAQPLEPARDIRPQALERVTVDLERQVG